MPGPKRAPVFFDKVQESGSVSNSGSVDLLRLCASSSASSITLLNISRTRSRQVLNEASDHSHARLSI